MAKKNPNPDPKPDSKPEPADIREMTAATVGRDILQALVTELKLLPKPWVAMTRKKQDDVIERLRDRVDYNVKMAVHLIASSGRTVVQGDLDQITIKDGAKAVIKIGRGAESLQDLYEAQGKAVLIVVASGADHTGGMEEVHGEADQRAMNLGQEYTDQAGDGMDHDDGGSNVIDTEVRTIEQQPLMEERQKAWDDGYAAGEAGKGKSDCPTMDHRLVTEWVHGWMTWHEEHDATATSGEETV